MSIQFLHLLLFIIIANGAPILIHVLLNDAFKLSVDFGQKLPDNKRVFGDSKTWRGIFAALTATAIAAWLTGYSPATGLMIGAYAVIGDLLSSFIKRRLGMQPSSMAPLIDQVPESLLPAYKMKSLFALDNFSVFLLVLIFIIIELILSHVFYKWGLRNRPY